MAIVANRNRHNVDTLYYVTNLVALYKKYKYLLVFTVLFSIIFLGINPTALRLEITGNITSALHVIRTIIDETNTNIKHTVLSKASILNENLELKRRIEYLLKVQNDLSHMSLENNKLKDLLNFTAQYNFEYKSYKFLTHSSMHEALIEGVSDINTIVLGPYGVIGKVTGNSKHYSRIILINNVESKIPVISASSGEKAILIGNGTNLQLIHLSPSNKLRAGEILLTSGDGALYPYGIPVAKVIKIEDNTAIAAGLNDIQKIEFVSVIKQKTNNNAN